MNAKQVAQKTEKQAQRLFLLYSKKGIRDIKKAIREAQRSGLLYAAILIRPDKFINDKILLRIRKYLVNFLETNGFYVRIYGFGQKMELYTPEEILFSWGADIERFRKIDNIQEKMMQEK